MMIYNSGNPPPRAETALQDHGLTCRVCGAVPFRRSYGYLAAALIAFAVYGSLVPFDLQPVPAADAWEALRATLIDPPPRRISRSNFLANILLFVPIGFALMGMLLTDRRSRWLAVPAALVTVSASVFVSAVVEFLQIFARGRVPSRVDIGAQTIGCAIGVAGWIVAGPALTRWVRTTSSAAGGDRLTRALAVYVAAWVFVNLAPFDITVDAGHIARRLREGLITIVPYAHPSLTGWRIAWDVFATALSAVPIGVFGSIGGIAAGRRRGAAAAFGVGTALVVVIELMQVFIRSHAADSGDAAAGALGVGLGVWLATALQMRAGSSAPATALEGRGWASAAVATWCLLILAYHWMPYDFEHDPAAVERKLEAISLVPFSGYWSGSYVNALNDLLVKLGLAIPLGVGAVLALRPRARLPTPLVVACVSSAGLLFGLSEAGQFFLPSRTPEPTDVLIGTVGVVLGLWLGRWLFCDR